jgi:hypothetical protein
MELAVMPVALLHKAITVLDLAEVEDLVLLQLHVLVEMV